MPHSRSFVIGYLMRVALYARYVAWRQQRSKRRAMRDLRSHLRFFGVPIDDITDEQIEAGVLRASQIVARAGITGDEARTAINRVLSRLL